MLYFENKTRQKLIQMIQRVPLFISMTWGKKEKKSNPTESRMELIKGMRGYPYGDELNLAFTSSDMKTTVDLEMLRTPL